MMILSRKADSYINFMRSVSSPYVIAALCPKFKKLRNYDQPKKISGRHSSRPQEERLQARVLGNQTSMGKPDRYMCREEISELRKYGRVRVFERIDAEDRARAKSFRAFVLSAL